MLAHPGIVFRDGPAGRRAGLAAGPDVAEVIAILQHLEATGEEAVAETTAWLEQPIHAIRGRAPRHSAADDYTCSMTSSVLSLRVPPPLAEELRRRSEAAGLSAAALAQRILDEGLRMERHPGITFRGGPSGRRAGLPRGPDVWEVVSVLRRLDAEGDEAVAEAAEWLGQPAREIHLAIDYYTDHPEEVDAQLRLSDEEQERLQRTTERRQLLLG